MFCILYLTWFAPGEDRLSQWCNWPRGWSCSPAAKTNSLLPANLQQIFCLLVHPHVDNPSGWHHGPTIDLHTWSPSQQESHLLLHCNSSWIFHLGAVKQFVVSLWGILNLNYSNSSAFLDDQVLLRQKETFFMFWGCLQTARYVIEICFLTYNSFSIYI